MTLTVVGVLEELSSSEATTNNDMALVPATTYAQRLVGGASRNSVSSIYVKATSSGTLSAAYQEADALLLNRHGITDAANADFSIATAAVDPLGRHDRRRHDEGDARPASP